MAASKNHRTIVCLPLQEAMAIVLQSVYTCIDLCTDMFIIDIHNFRCMYNVAKKYVNIASGAVVNTVSRLMSLRLSEDGAKIQSGQGLVCY